MKKSFGTWYPQSISSLHSIFTTCSSLFIIMSLINNVFLSFDFFLISKNISLHKIHKDNYWVLLQHNLSCFPFQAQSYQWIWLVANIFLSFSLSLSSISKHSCLPWCFTKNYPCSKLNDENSEGICKYNSLVINLSIYLWFIDRIACMDSTLIINSHNY